MMISVSESKKSKSIRHCWHKCLRWDIESWSWGINTHAHRFKSKVLGSRLSRPGSPRAALSQLRSTERAGWGGMGDGRGGGGGVVRDREIFQRTSVTVSNLWAAFFQPALWPTDSLAWLDKNYESFRGGLSPCTRPGRPHTDPVRYTSPSCGENRQDDAE